MVKEHEIVFEDLHGDVEERHATVDLDADSKEKGVELHGKPPGGDGVGEEFEDIRRGQDGGEEGGEGDPPDKARKKAGEDGDDEPKRGERRKPKRDRRSDAAREEAEFWQEQARESRKQLREMKKRQYEDTVQRVDSDLESIESQLEKAHEDGDTKSVVKLTSRMTDLKAQKARAEVELEGISETDDDFPEYGKKTSQRGKVASSESVRAELVSDWMDQNDDWYGRKGFERQTRVANRIDKEVFADGFDPGTEEYYDELSARIKEKLPDLFDDTGQDKGSDDPPRKRGQTPVAPARGAESSATKKSSSSRVELDEQDFENMRRFNLDVNDPEVLKEYARNKREAEKSALARQR